MEIIKKMLSLVFCALFFVGCSEIKPLAEKNIYNVDSNSSQTINSAAGNNSISSVALTSAEIIDSSESNTESVSKNENTPITTQPSNAVTTKVSESNTSKVTTSTTYIPPVTTAPNVYYPLNYSKQKGVWMSYLDIDNNLWGKSESQFKAYINQAFSNIRNLGANTVYVQVRSFGNAYYNSSYFSWGNDGKNPGFDPLKIMVDIGHSKGLSIHAWINPFRAAKCSKISYIPDNYLIKKWYNDSSTNGKQLVKVGDYYYLNPAYDDVRQLVLNGVSEIVRKYNVDGIHIDDYFYPTTDKSFDSEAFKASGQSNLSKWRMGNIDKLVSGIYKTVKQSNSKVLFGVSPQGNVNNNYTTMYADVKKWCSQSGYLDYVVPQIYWGDISPHFYFSTRTKEWDSIVKSSNVKLVIGLAAYKATGEGAEFSGPDTIANQIKSVDSLKNNDGIALFRYGSMFGGTTKQSEVDAIRKVLKN